MDLTAPDPRSRVSHKAAPRTTALSNQHLPSGSQPDNDVFTVVQLNRQARMMLEQGLGNVCVEGELSNFSQPASGHWYFTLKDANAQIRCAMFRQQNRLVRPVPQNGDKLQIRGKITLYEARGDYQLVASHIEAAGEGALRQAYEALRQQLEEEGLFAEDQKQALPQWPQTIGVITSPSGAAVRDIMDVLQRRYPAANVIVYPAAVQGEAAPSELLQALHNAVSRQEADVLVIGRGGGSIEDLWAFNDKTLVRAVANCPIPIVSAVGHETDFSLCDFVADLRAPTPSAAAELVSPLAEDWLNWIRSTEEQLSRGLERRIQQSQQQLDTQSHRLQQQHPLRRLQSYQQDIEHLQSKLINAATQYPAKQLQRLSRLTLRLQAQAPQQRLSRLQNRYLLLQQRLKLHSKTLTQASQQRLRELSSQLNVVSPLATLERGYAIASDVSGKPVTDAEQVKSGDQLAVKLAKGELNCRVD